MATKLIPKGEKIHKWKFPADAEDPDACIFHIKLRNNRHRIETDILKAAKLIQDSDDFGNNLYGDNIVKIENVEGKVLTERKDIVDFCLDRLSDSQGVLLQLAIQGLEGWLDKGLIKN